MNASLITLVLSQLLTHRPPGKSPYSFEVIPECGLNPTTAECAIERVCEEPAFWCSAPRFSKARNAWVKIETREAGLKRYLKFSEDLVTVVRRLTRCTDHEGVAIEECERVKWWAGSQDLSLIGATVAIFESGMSEGPQNGHPPLGIGADGEVCMLGIMPQYAAPFASWLSKEEKERLGKASFKEQREWAMRDLHGESNIKHCIEVSLRELVAAKRRCKSDFGMFSSYASGICNTSAITVPLRVSLLQKMRGANPTLPKWAAEELGSNT